MIKRPSRQRTIDSLPPGALAIAYGLQERGKLTDAWTHIDGGAAARRETRRDGQFLVLAPLKGKDSPETKMTVAIRLSRTHTS